MTLNQIIQNLEQIATSHRQINTFGFGDIWEIATSGDIVYPLMWVDSEGVQVDNVAKTETYNFSFLFMDTVKNGEVNETEVLSDQLSIAKDVLAQLKHPSYTWSFQNNNSTLEDFTERFVDSVSGWKMNVSLVLQFSSDRCVIPYVGNINPATIPLGGSGSGGAGSPTFVNSVTGTSNRITVSPTTGDVIVDIASTYVGQTSITTLGTIGTGTWQGTSISTSFTDAKIKTVTGTTNRIDITGTSTDPIFDISSSYIGQSSITTLGTISTGVWNGTPIGNSFLENSSLTIGTTNISLGATSPSLLGLTSLGIGTSSVSASTHIKGTTSNNSAFSLKIDNSSDSPLFYLRNDNHIGHNVSPSDGIQYFLNGDGSTYGFFSQGSFGVSNFAGAGANRAHFYSVNGGTSGLEVDFTDSIAFDRQGVLISNIGTNSSSNIGIKIDVRNGATNNAIHVQNGDVKLTPLTASTLIYLDSVKNVTSLANASGLLSNDGLGSFSYTLTPTLTSLTTPLIIGGTAVGSFIQHKSTTANGTTTGLATQFTGGNNGATTIASLYNDGQFLIGTTTRQATAFGIASVVQGTSRIDFGEQSSGAPAIWLGQTTNTANNFTLNKNGTITRLNAGAATDSISFSFSGNNRATFTQNLFTFSPAALSGGNAAELVWNSAAATGKTAGSEIFTINFDLSATLQHASNTAITTQRDFVIQARTHSFANATGTITNAATLAITGAPIVGTNAAITNSYSFWSQSGTVQVDGRVKIGAGTTTLEPLKFTIASSSLLNTASSGTIETDGNGWLYYTPNGTNRRTITLGGGRTDSGTTVTILFSDANSIVHCSNTNAVTVNMPLTTSIPQFTIIWIKDASGNAGTNARTMNRSGSDTFEGGVTTNTITQNYQMKGYYHTGTNVWFIA